MSYDTYVNVRTCGSLIDTIRLFPLFQSDGGVVFCEFYLFGVFWGFVCLFFCFFLGGGLFFGLFFFFFEVFGFFCVCFLEGAVEIT